MRYFDIDKELKDPQRPRITLKLSQYMTMDFTRGEHSLCHVTQETRISLPTFQTNTIVLLFYGRK